MSFPVKRPVWRPGKWKFQNSGWVFHDLPIRVNILFNHLKRNYSCAKIFSSFGWNSQLVWPAVILFSIIDSWLRKSYKFFILYLTLIGKSWKTHPEILPIFQFSGVSHRRISGKLIQYFFEISISGAWAGPISGKFIHHFFVSTYFQIHYRL